MVHAAIEAARAVGPSIAARADEIEKHRTLPLDVVDLIKPTGAFRMYVPDELGGPGVTAWESLEVIAELAYHEAAAGWCSMIGSTTSLNSNHLPPVYAEEIFSDPDAIAGGFAMPAGHAVAVDGGLRVTGRWQWGSGSRHCTWIGGGCRVVDADGTPTPRQDGLATPFVFFPSADVDFIDNWDVIGLSGTGSSDYRVDDVFVPEGRWVQIGLDEPTSDNSFSRFSFYGLLACGVAACTIGIGRRAVDELVAVASDKKPQGSRRTLAERAPVQADVARSEALLASSWTYLEHAISSAWDSAEAGDVPNVEQRRQLRLSATHAAQSGAQVAELMYRAAGGAAVYRTNPLQRTFRDAYVAIQHAMVAERTYEAWGRLRLDLATDTAMM